MRRRLALAASRVSTAGELRTAIAGRTISGPDTVVADTGRLEGNNARVFRGDGGPSATGRPTEHGWLFDFAFNSAASAETLLFFAGNFVHDLFYDLGFDEPAGNFQADNFDRGGMGGDPLQPECERARTQ